MESTDSESARGGFTLIELLVVISIIALLASVVLASLNTARDGARSAAARTDMRTIIKAIVLAQGQRYKTLMGITGSNCSACSCNVGSYYDMSTTACYNRLMTSLTDIQNATDGIYPTLTKFARDPWGNAYKLDENQGENGNCSSVDTLRSAGPDGKTSGSYSSDDIISPIPIPPAPKCP